MGTTKERLKTIGKWTLIIFIVWELSQMLIGCVLGFWLVLGMYGII